MTTVRRGTKVPARWRLFACGLFLLASCVVASSVIGWMRQPPLKSSSPLTPADTGADMPVPKQHNRSSFKTTHAPGVEAPLRVGLEAHVQAELGDVLAFYRTELLKRGWQEKPDGAVVAADHAQLAFVSPKGPATLKLGRAKDETTVDLVRSDTEAAARANVLPTLGQARLIFGFLAPDMASLAINNQTIKIAGGVNHPQTLDLPPGTYSYGLLLSGRLVSTNTITVAAGEAWSLRLGDGDQKPDQIY
ncbi:hypothetical protein JQ607_26845 [Bradyrhizobium liaoningense]|uniref:hypothetical protein n=1 Tax=Bradyrhizobium liaoningense TaxID=43992 RepID=UPI001BA8C931|nr:hypothetical protein [Bradyrhizobium liaoningense]MBR0843829.1 hypothetical protein [Bradyrhizobium liaoningense]MBR0856411.1 hypothetical protein [Bradyrhizobium liaoningense]